MNPPAFSLFAPYLCKTPSLWVSCESLCVVVRVCVLTNLLHVSHLHCCRPFAAPLLDSLVHRDPTSPPPLLLLLFPSSAVLSLKVLFTASSAVHSLFGYRLPPGQKLYSSLCLPVRLHRRSPSSIFPLYPLPFIPFFSSFLSLSTEGFGTHLLKFPICTACLSVAYHRWSFVLFAQKKQRRSRTGKERMHSKKHFNHTQTDTDGKGLNLESLSSIFTLY